MSLPRTAAMVAVSVALLPVMVIPAPLASVSVSVVLSATGEVPAGVAMVAKVFVPVPVASVLHIHAELPLLHLMTSSLLQLFCAMSAKRMVPLVISAESMEDPKSFVRESVTVPPRETLPPPLKPAPADTVRLLFARSPLAIEPSVISVPSTVVPKLV
jgi:hypothetical protein